MHIHEAEEEGFYVVSGKVRIVVGARTVDASAGSFVMVPRGESHAFVLASVDARLLLLVTPGSQHERLFRAIGAPATRRELPPAPSGPPDLAALAAVAAANGTKLVGRRRIRSSHAGHQARPRERHRHRRTPDGSPDLRHVTP